MVDSRIIERIPARDAIAIRAAELLPDLSAVARELVENSLDSSSSEIIITYSLRERTVQVSDNGRGIDFDDLER